MRHLLIISATALVMTTTAAASQSSSNSGAYLAATAGLRAGDFAAVAEHAEAALAFDHANDALRFSVAEAALMLGEVERAAGIIAEIDNPRGVALRLANLLAMDQALKDRDFARLQTMLDTPPVLMPLFDTLLSAWVAFGEGRLDDALAVFDRLQSRGQSELSAIALYQRALMLAMIGNLEAAEEALASGGIAATNTDGTLLYFTLLVKMGRRDEALTEISEIDPRQNNLILGALRARIEAGQALPDFGVTSEREAIARALLAMATLFRRDDEWPEALRLARMAETMEPDLASASVMVAELFQRLNLTDMAIDAYGRVSADAFDQKHYAVMQRTRLLAGQGAHEAALEAIGQLADQEPDAPRVQMALGDQLRRMNRYADAVSAYDQAIEIWGNSAPWSVYFARGIAYERIGDWPRSEADLRAALALNPNEALVLNYLGYSLVEEGQDLGEALALIERAVAADPSSGAIVDSLGWVQYRLGRYEEAVIQLERAVELEPDDPVINDHLGDALWQVGRKREAQFQWRRALSFKPEPEEAEKIRQKLDTGLRPITAVTDTAP